jgi:hypothetical protein
MAELPLVKKCHHCGRVAKNVLLCRGCHAVYFCDSSCQRSGWKSHKTQCRKASSQTLIDTVLESPAVTNQEAFLEASSRTLRVVVTMEDVERNLECVRSWKLALRPGESEAWLKRDEMEDHGTVNPLPLLHNKALRVGPSPVHGRGVFAKKQLPPKVIVTFYPCDAIHSTDTGELCVYRQDPATDISLKEEALLQDYGFWLSGERDVRIIGNPRRRFHSRLLGHMVNDGATDVLAGVKVEELEAQEKTVEKVFQYCRESMARQNCEFQLNSNRTVVAIVTTRLVEAGEELFTSYGLIYWLEHHYGVGYEEVHPFIHRNIMMMSGEEKEEIGRILFRC